MPLKASGRVILTVIDKQTTNAKDYNIPIGGKVAISTTTLKFRPVISYLILRLRVIFILQTPLNSLILLYMSR